MAQSKEMALTENGMEIREETSTDIRSEWDVPDDVFRVSILDPLKMKDVSGLARYRDEFSTVS